MTPSTSISSSLIFAASWFTSAGNGKSPLPGMSPDYLHRIPRDQRIGSNQSQFFDLGLTDQKTIKRIFVYGGQVRHAEHVSGLHGKGRQPVPANLQFQKP